MRRLILVALLLTSCAQPVEAAPVNADDVMFLQMMIPHHKQGIEIVRQVRAGATSEKTRILAGAIEVSQNAEVNTMIGWLAGWGQPQSAPTNAHAHHGGLPETDREQIAALRKAKDFERDFLNLLIAHQDDAVQMAKIEIFNGVNPEVKTWAKQVEQSREAQIDQMLVILNE
ncbi:DUF305 domain-containing protein [Nonomuraea sp. NPDC046570]|uniref:DUF305 domain-containing protein n=1 Tax=Nonomuraea sp. NPDC046570 TaxID=3155255 RepID=UPI00340EB7CA